MFSKVVYRLVNNQGEDQMYSVVRSFSQHMLTHGADYKLLKDLESLDVNKLDTTDRLILVRSKVKETVQAAFENSAKRYKLRSRAYSSK